ncbi:MAG: hypothetical protein FIB02_12530 [Desulfuromonas sp.]|nr:hypothetical protein [Desulfuromonas sp.]
MTKTQRISRIRHGEEGMALLLAIAFLAILSILGAVMLDVATRDLKEGGTFMPARQAFYTADRAVEYSVNRNIIIDLEPQTQIDLFNNLKYRVNNDGSLTSLGATATDHKAIINGAGVGTLVSGSVTDLGPNELPPSVSAVYGSEFGANFYNVEVETNAPGGAQSRVNASIVRLFKSDDDTIFRTSGGG